MQSKTTPLRAKSHDFGAALVAPSSCTSGKDYYAAIGDINAKVTSFQQTFSGIFKTTMDVEKALKDAGADVFLDFGRVVETIKQELEPAAAPVRAVGDVFGGIADALQYLK